MEENSLLEAIANTYAQFFDLNMWAELLTDPKAWAIILTLVILEGLLSADNALVLAIMVKHLPEKQRKKALMYGLWGAYLFRFIAIGLGTTLAKYWVVKLVGAGYLLWIAIKFFVERFGSKKEEETEEEDPGAKIAKGFLTRFFGVFWGTVVAVELMDIAFSVDSILAAIAIDDRVGILFLGGVFGILMMRGVAGVFIKLIERVPELEYTAFGLIAMIGLKMALSVEQLPIHYHVSHGLFFSLIAVAFVITFIVHYARKKKVPKEA